MPEPRIIKQEVVVIDSHELDDYGNMTFIDKAGNKHKISSKREQFFELIEDGLAVELFYAKYMDKLYIAEVQRTVLPPATEPQPLLEEHQQEIDKVVATAQPIAPQERGMWWKELGEMIRVKDIDVTQPAGKLLRMVYYNEMMRVLGIKLESKLNKGE